LHFFVAKYPNSARILAEGQERQTKQGGFKYENKRNWLLDIWEKICNKLFAFFRIVGNNSGW
jgi:hypothetical protein